ncbi:MAG: hypothetical protein A2234_10370 [Elusimicrobia bacterium RIFOXYA2_FULL_58_8]|nr:MAG: hypothetical protein A2285_04305 [Elusimicrobia bacterium RIFOXYA12_FULL_57_11]OGS14586.1 MAG: hypothetical protein A2234_10370 [Elusimicrobia bacterium RIFOXYA2_FULL_58_8]
MAADANKTLAEVTLSLDPRFWEAFPVMLANAAETGEFSAQAAMARLQAHEKENFKALLLLSAALYRSLGLRFAWAETAVAGFARGALNDYMVKFRENSVIKIAAEQLQPQNIRACFLTCFKKSVENIKTAAAAREQLGLEYALSRIFPPRQKQIFLKKLRGTPLTKMEKEYFSRVIRKKTLALANDDLHRMAIKILE